MVEFGSNPVTLPANHGGVPMSAPEFPTESRALLSSGRFRNAKQELIGAIVDASSRVRSIRPHSSSQDARDAFKSYLQEFNRDRGRDLFYPYIASGLGSGPFVELIDGSVKYDM